MIHAFVFIDTDRKEVRRYVTIKPLMVSHEATLAEDQEFSYELIESFRTKPSDEFRVRQPETPPIPPTNGSPAIVKAA